MNTTPVYEAMIRDYLKQARDAIDKAYEYMNELATTPDLDTSINKGTRQ